MTTMTISLSEELTDFVSQQIKAHSYASASDYLGDLVRRQKDVETLRRKLLNGANSGPGRTVDEVWFAELNAQASEEI